MKGENGHGVFRELKGFQSTETQQAVGSSDKLFAFTQGRRNKSIKYL